MSHLEKSTKLLQFLGAALAVPAAAGGVYSAYTSYFSTDAVCESLRNTTLAILDKNVPVEAKRVLLRQDATKFEAKCSASDPEAAAIFQAALRELDETAPNPAPNAAVGPGRTAPVPGPARPAPSAARTSPGPTQTASLAPGAAMEMQHSVHGWVALLSRAKGKVMDVYFEGFPPEGPSPPESGKVLSALGWRPIWSEPLGPGPADPGKLAGRLKLGECVRVVATRNGGGRLWAEIDPVACP
jgi:hypothetical protein